MRLAIAALPLFYAACGGDGAEGPKDAASLNCSTEWDCVNGVCECADGSSCDDADDCDVACEVCE